MLRPWETTMEPSQQNGKETPLSLHPDQEQHKHPAEMTVARRAQIAFHNNV